ncbi:MAG TPA: hypothetical protein PLE30_09285 [Candidatus Kapabacteria bacterium]|nr:hypothetical protein [Candidatus Kapabacteria bacterium]
MAKKVKVDDNPKYIEYIQNIIDKKADFDESKKLLIDGIKKFMPDYNPTTLKSVNFDRTLIEFENWLVQTITNDPIPSSVKSIWFGLNDNSKDESGGLPEIQLLMCGSKFLPENKPNDWYKNDLWDATGKNSEIKALKTISNTIKNFQDLQPLILNYLLLALTVILVQNGFDLIKHEFLIYQKKLIIGCGFDNGTNFIVGYLTENGISSQESE